MNSDNESNASRDLLTVSESEWSAAKLRAELIAPLVGMASARARGRKGGRPYKMTQAKLRLAMAAMGQSETKIGVLCEELGITKQTLYRHLSPIGALRSDGKKLLIILL